MLQRALSDINKSVDYLRILTGWESVVPSSNSRQVWRCFCQFVARRSTHTFHRRFITIFSSNMFHNAHARASDLQSPAKHATGNDNDTPLSARVRSLQTPRAPFPFTRARSYQRSSSPWLPYVTRRNSEKSIRFLWLFFKEINLFWILQNQRVSTPFPAWWVSSSRFRRSSVEHPWRCRATELGRGRNELWPIIGRYTSVTGASNQRLNLKWLLTSSLSVLRRA